LLVELTGALIGLTLALRVIQEVVLIDGEFKAIASFVIGSIS